jgi:ketosteroid isomerase-like protein
MKADAKTETAVLAVLKAFSEGYDRQDLKGLLALHVSDPDSVIFTPNHTGMGLSGIKALIELDLASPHPLSVAFEKISVSSAGPVAWLAGEVSFSTNKGDKKETLFTGRVTFVLEYRTDKWLIMQGHISPLAAN